MINFATVGTSWITGEFITTAKTFPDIRIKTAYSRDAEKGKAFCLQYGAESVCTDMEAIASDREINAVYIASPNSLHKEHSMFFLSHGKHVICEKPIASNAYEAEEMFECAKANGVVLMEAYKSALMPGMKAVAENLPKLGILRSVFSVFAKYSSRYDAHKEGKNVNTFKAEFSNGALMDLGLYCLYPVLYLFGKPDEIKALSVIIPDGVDGAGTLIMRYGSFVATLNYTKVSNSFLPCEIQGEEATMLIDKLNIPERLEIVYRDKSREREIIDVCQRKDSMCYEIEEFISCIENNRFSSVNSPSLSLLGMSVMDEARKQCGVIYPADNR